MHTLGDYRLSDLSTLPTLAPGRVPDYSEQTVQVTTEVNVCSPDLNFPNNSLSRESLFFRVLFSFDLDLCVTAGSRLTRLIVNLSPNSNPDIYHGLISVQIRVQQNWNIIEVTPNLTVQYSTQKCIYLNSCCCYCTLCCRNVIMCVPRPAVKIHFVFVI